MNKVELLDKVSFVISECARFKAIVASGGFKSIDLQDVWCSITRFDKRGDVICGRAAIKVLSELADEAAFRGGIVNTVSPEVRMKEMQLEFSRRFLKDDAVLDVKQVDRLISSVARRAASHCETITHLIPCHLMHSSDPQKIELGPVTFYGRKEMRKILLVHLKGASVREEKPHLRRLKAEAIRFYRNFRWVAQVTIEDCDKETSGRVAYEAVTAALNCLHLLLGANKTRRMRVGGLHIASDRRAKLHIDAEDILHPTTSFAYFGEVAFPDGWSVVLGSSNEYQQLLGVALESVVNPKLLRPLSKRFLDSAQWFGEATRDEGDATKIIKYATALERLLMTGERDDITTTLAERIAALCIQDQVSRDDWRAISRRVYGLRSKLVHGGISPASTNLRKGVKEAVDLSEAALFYSIGAFGVEGLRDNDFKESKLPKWFKAVVGWADRFEVSKLRDDGGDVCVEGREGDGMLS